MKKYPEFIDAFPTVHDMAGAPLSRVLGIWQGLGYNRRGRYLHETAKIIAAEHNGTVPDDPVLLERLPGIGKATAASICAFAYNVPVVFIETNIRTVYIFFFFHGMENIDDGDIFPLIEKTLYRENPRIWYWALMDLGVWIKREFGNVSRMGKNYRPQSPFDGSFRQVRGGIIRVLAGGRFLTVDEIVSLTGAKAQTVRKALDALAAEKMIREKRGRYGL